MPEKLEEAVESLSEEIPAEVEPRPEGAVSSSGETDEGSAEKVDELAALRQELEEQKTKAAEYLDGWQRARAEFANYKKRIEKEQEDMIKSANGVFIAKLLPVMDDFERAFQTLPPDLMRMTWLEGIALIQRKLQFLLEQEGVTIIATEGQMFDPISHEAVTYEESEEHEEGQIIAEVQKGYKMGDKVLRPSLVRVAKRVTSDT